MISWTEKQTRKKINWFCLYDYEIMKDLTN